MRRARDAGSTDGMARDSRKPDRRLLVAAGAMASGAAAARAAARARARRRAKGRRYRLRDGERLGEGIRRIAHGQMELVMAELQRSDRDRASDDAVHEARKALKRLRALIRLARDELGPHVRRRENAALRDAGRRLSGARDARVLVETLDGLVARNRDVLAPGAFAALRDELVRSRDEAADGAGGVPEVVAAARARVDGWPLPDGKGTAALAPGLKRIYRRGRRAYRAADSDPTPEHLHELRKRTKDLRHAAQVLRPAAPKRLRKLARSAHELADVLGEDHDLVTLLEASRSRPAALAPGERALLEELAGQRRARLRAKALRRARKLYSRKARKVARLA